MTTTLSEGVKVPDVGSVNWAGDLEVNWNLLNGALANLSGNVKLDRDNTWTGEQSFTLPIVGSITGTASKAIADEDGTSIKSGYGKLAGSQTWTGNNTFTGNAFLESAFVRNTAIIPGSTPSSAQTITQTYVANSNATLGYSRVVLYDTGVTTFEVATRNKFSNGALDPSGTYTESKMTVGLDNTGLGYFAITGKVKNSLTPFTNSTYTLGTSSYQWSSVYAQTYYYNGTAWGLDKANEWTGSNKFKSANSNFGLQSTIAEAGSTTATSNWIYWQDKNGFQDAYISRDVWSDGGDTLRISISGKRSNGAPSTSGASVECGIRLDITANGSKSVRPFDNGSTDLGTSTNKWKSLNGINPGALSLPDASIAVSIGTTDVHMDGTYTYLPVSVNGWLYVALKDTTCKTDGELTFYTGDSGTSSAYAKWATNFVCSTDGYVRCFIPVLANSRIRIRVNPNGGSPTSLSMIIYPCLGNV